MFDFLKQKVRSRKTGEKDTIIETFEAEGRHGQVLYRLKKDKNVYTKSSLLKRYEFI